MTSKFQTGVAPVIMLAFLAIAITSGVASVIVYKQIDDNQNLEAQILPEEMKSEATTTEDVIVEEEVKEEIQESEPEIKKEEPIKKAEVKKPVQPNPPVQPAPLPPPAPSSSNIPDSFVKSDLCKNKAESGRQYIIDYVSKRTIERNPSGTIAPNQMNQIIEGADNHYRDTLSKCLLGGELYWAMENAYDDVLRICKQYYTENNPCRDTTDIWREIEARERVCNEYKPACVHAEKLRNAYNKYTQEKKAYDSQ